MGHLLKPNCAHSPLNLGNLSSTCVPFTLGASAKFSTNSQEMDYSVVSLSLSQTECFSVFRMVRHVLVLAVLLFLSTPVLMDDYDEDSEPEYDTKADYVSAGIL
jgi:hypothetical protein